MSFLAPEIIKKKRSGAELSRDEIEFMVNGFISGSVPDYQMSALLMAIFFRGMQPSETWQLTDVMMRSGRVLDFSRLGFTVDKHSTGGVGDKTSLILAPIAAAAGVRVPMIAGRGLGHTGGTIDKLETIPGFTCDISISQFERQVETLGVALIGQTAEICPADKKIYALRDVTATIESLPLICASIMSKKMAEGIQGLVLDVKWGSGAFMKTVEQASELADALCAIGKAGGKRVVAYVTNMNQPLGRFIGNSLEVEECIAILQRKGLRGSPLADFSDCENLSVELAAAMIHLGGNAATLEAARVRARDLLESGAAYRKFEELVAAQGGDLSKLPSAAPNRVLKATQAGVLTDMNCEQIGYAGLEMGAGRARSSDAIDPIAGIEMHVRLGDRIVPNQSLCTLYGTRGLDSAETRIRQALKIGESSHSKVLAKRGGNDLIAMTKGF